MVDDEITDGRRIAELLASELTGRRDGELAALSVVDADRDVEPTVGGARAYDVERRPPSPEDGPDGGECGSDDGEHGSDDTEDGSDDGEHGSDDTEDGSGNGGDGSDGGEGETDDGESVRLARAFVHPDRLHLEFGAGREAAADAARDAGLRVRPKAATPPRTLVFVERGAAVKRATDVLSAASRSVGNDSR